MQAVSVVVPTCRRATTLALTLESLAALEYPRADYELIVADDADDPATAEVTGRFRTHDLNLEVVRNRRHGAAAARNAGARAAQGDLLLFCDDDMILAPDHLRSHIATHAAFSDAIVGGERWYSPTSLAAFEATPFGRFRVDLERKFVRGRDERPLGGNCAHTTVLASCDLSIGREAFWGVGGFDEAFPYAGAEDQDFCLRAARVGFRLIRNNAIRALHNDPTVTLRQFCKREERGAETVFLLGRKWPQLLGDFCDIEAGLHVDRPRIMAKNVVKAVLSSKPALSAIHRAVYVLERGGTRDVLLRHVYTKVLALHIFRGYRRALRQAG